MTLCRNKLKVYLPRGNSLNDWHEELVWISSFLQVALLGNSTGVRSVFIVKPVQSRRHVLQVQCGEVVDTLEESRVAAWRDTHTHQTIRSTAAS